MEVFLEDIFATAVQVTEEVRRRLKLGQKDLSQGTVRNVLGDILKVQAKINKLLAHGQAHVREDFLLEELFAMVDQLMEGSPDEKQQKKLAHLQEQLCLDGKACQQKAAREPDQDLQPEIMKKEGDVAGWAKEYVLMFLLYWHGISLSTLGKWFS